MKFLIFTQLDEISDDYVQNLLKHFMDDIYTTIYFIGSINKKLSEFIRIFNTDEIWLEFFDFLQENIKLSFIERGMLYLAKHYNMILVTDNSYLFDICSQNNINAISSKDFLTKLEVQYGTLIKKKAV